MKLQFLWAIGLSLASSAALAAASAYYAPYDCLGKAALTKEGARTLVIGSGYNEEGFRATHGWKYAQTFDPASHILMDRAEGVAADVHADVYAPGVFEEVSDRFQEVRVTHLGHGLPIDWYAYCKDLLHGNKAPTPILRHSNATGEVYAISLNVNTFGERHYSLILRDGKDEPAPDATYFLEGVARSLQSGGSFQYTSTTWEPSSHTTYCPSFKPAEKELYPVHGKPLFLEAKEGSFAPSDHVEPITMPVYNSTTDRREPKHGALVHPFLSLKELEGIYQRLMDPYFRDITVKLEHPTFADGSKNPAAFHLAVSAKKK